MTLSVYDHSNRAQREIAFDFKVIAINTCHFVGFICLIAVVLDAPALYPKFSDC